MKILNKEDIESLGWNFFNKSISDWFIIDKHTRYLSGHHCFTYKLIWDRNNQFINEKDFCPNIKILANIEGEDETIFEGIINNKQELKKLMKQLNIIK